MDGLIVNVVDSKDMPCGRGSAGLPTQKAGQGVTVSNFTEITEKDRK